MPLGGGRAPEWRARPWVEGAWVEGAPLGGGRLGGGRAPGWRARPKESGIVGNLLIQHTVSRWCSSGCVHDGCGGVDRWLQTKD